MEDDRGQNRMVETPEGLVDPPPFHLSDKKHNTGLEIEQELPSDLL
jgi:hypothetical protein